MRRKKRRSRQVSSDASTRTREKCTLVVLRGPATNEFAKFFTRPLPLEERTNVSVLLPAIGDTSRPPPPAGPRGGDPDNPFVRFVRPRNLRSLFASQGFEQSARSARWSARLRPFVGFRHSSCFTTPFS